MSLDIQSRVNQLLLQQQEIANAPFPGGGISPDQFEIRRQQALANINSQIQSLTAVLRLDSGDVIPEQKSNLLPIILVGGAILLLS